MGMRITCLLSLIRDFLEGGMENKREKNKG